jgi:hypothetical protein
MTHRADLEGAIAMQSNGIIGEAKMHADIWQLQGREWPEYTPPLFRMPGVELPIVPRIAPRRLPRTDPGFGRWAR